MIVFLRVVQSPAEQGLSHRQANSHCYMPSGLERLIVHFKTAGCSENEYVLCSSL